jgi:uncharacterized protein (TIGR00297 family)
MNFTHILKPVPPKGWVIISLLFLGIIVLLGLSEIVRRRLDWPAEFSRKLVHISAGILFFFAPILIESSLPFVIIALLFIIINYIALKKGFLKGMNGERETFGTIFYPISFLILVLFAWQDHKIIIIISMMIMAIGDALAAIVGESLPNTHNYLLITEKKTLEGSITMFVTSTIIIFVVLQSNSFRSYVVAYSSVYVLWIAIITAVISTVAEALSTKGSDNLSVPLFSAVILYFMINHTSAENVQLTIGLILATIVSIVSFYFRFLDKSGAVATFLLAAIIFGFGGWKWSIPILVFFVSSSLLSMVGKTRKIKVEQIFEKSSHRDYAQVLANGGVAGIIMIIYMFYEIPNLYIFYLAAIAAAIADTWATEIGTLTEQQPRLINNLQKVPLGTSGGITTLGILGSLLGALIIAMSGLIFITNLSSKTLILFLITFSGTLASLVDSYLGATVQIKYQCPICNKITERKIHCNKIPTTPIGGIDWISNDIVNLINTLSSVIFISFAINIFS